MFEIFVFQIFKKFSFFFSQIIIVKCWNIPNVCYIVCNCIYSRPILSVTFTLIPDKFSFHVECTAIRLAIDTCSKQILGIK